MIELADVFIRKENVVLREIAGETLLVPISGDLADLERLFCLNDVGGYIWKSLDPGLSVEKLAAMVLKEFDADKVTVENDLKGLIAQLLDAGLVVFKS